jgi:hypothetical protein
MKKANQQATSSVTVKNKSTKLKRSRVMPKAVQKDLEVNFNLHPGLRDRIIAEMDRSKIPEDRRLQYLSMLTGRATQTARRWIDEEKAGLPDLLSFARLCFRFDSDANWMLGLTHSRFPLPKLHGGMNAQDDVSCVDDPDWRDHIADQIEAQASDCEVRHMLGDDMEPRIKNGAVMWVDTSITEIQTNGVYLLEYQGRTLVRQVEIRVGEGVVLSCENTRYKPTVIKDASVAKKAGLRVVGRIKLSIVTEKF